MCSNVYPYGLYPEARLRLAQHCVQTTSVSRPLTEQLWLDLSLVSSGFTTSSVVRRMYHIHPPPNSVPALIRKDTCQARLLAAAALTLSDEAYLSRKPGLNARESACEYAC